MKIGKPRHSMPQILSCALGLAALALPATAWAEEGAADSDEASASENQAAAEPSNVEAEASTSPDLSVSANVGFFTDYRFRGISLNNGRETIQGSITLNHQSGLYVSAWGSSFSAVPGDSSEIAVYAGYQRRLSGIDINIGVVDYIFPDNGALSFIEIYGSATAKLGPVSQTFGVYVAPDQNSDGVRRTSGRTGSSAYYYSTTSLPIPDLPVPVTLSATFGYERGARLLSEGGKFDWDLGASVRLIGLDWGLRYIGSDVPRVISATGNNITRSGVVASVSRSF